MSRQILKPHTQVQILGDSRLSKIETGIVEVAIESIFRPAPFPAADESREAVECLHVKTENFSDFARSQTATISTDVGSHGCAALTVALVKILDGFFPLVAAGQIEIDVRPLAAFFRKKALK